jgi:hypothetical protein
MSNGVNPRVGEVHQRNDNTVEIHVRTDSFKPGQEVEVSGYLIQGKRAYAAFNVKKHIPLDANPSAVLDVQLPALDLKPDENVTVVTRVAEVWPTILGRDVGAPYLGKGLKAAWSAEYPSGKETGEPASPAQGNGGGGATTS